MHYVGHAWNVFRSTLPEIALYFLGVAVFMVFEEIFPAEKHQPVRDKLLSAEFTILYLVVSPLLVILPNYYTVKIIHSLGGSLKTLDLNHVRLGIPGVDWILFHCLLPFLPLAVYDFFYYWFHRTQHMLPFLWEEHKLHHSEESVNSLTNLRHHWLEELLRIPFIVIPMGYLFNITPIQGALAAVLVSHWALFIHSNIRISLGPLTPILCGPQLHRIHHSKEPQHTDKNFSAFIPIWDVIFGTYCPPLRGEYPKTGLSDGERVNSFFEGTILPFRGWLKMLRSFANRQE